jgi:hypothetical protein
MELMKVRLSSTTFSQAINHPTMLHDIDCITKPYQTAATFGKARCQSLVSDARQQKPDVGTTADPHAQRQPSVT